MIDIQETNMVGNTVRLVEHTVKGRVGFDIIFGIILIRNTANVTSICIGPSEVFLWRGLS